MDRFYLNVPIGPACQNIRLNVTDPKGMRLPVGVPGELWSVWVQVGRGYLNRPELTKQVFIPHPFSQYERSDKISRSGDIVRFLEDGNIVFIARATAPVTSAGFRI